MENNITSAIALTAVPAFISRDALLEHWQGHRRLTRQVIDAFPEEKLFNYSIGGMRTFAQMSMELIGLAAPGIHGIAFGNWTFDNPPLASNTPPPATKQEILDLWDMVTEEINKVWLQIPAQRFQENDRAFGQYEGPVNTALLYLIDNEIHHRGQGYVYLRSLGIEPPAFWNRY